MLPWGPESKTVVLVQVAVETSQKVFGKITEEYFSNKHQHSSGKGKPKAKRWSTSASLFNKSLVLKMPKQLKSFDAIETIQEKNTDIWQTCPGVPLVQD